MELFLNIDEFIGKRYMVIRKIMNNNVVFVRDQKKRELILVGSGIGFKMKPGMKVDESKIEKTFVICKSTEQKRLVELLQKISVNDFKIVDYIIKYAEASLGTKLNENIYITLTDHIVFAIERAKKGMNISNALLWEIKQFYAQEYEIGKHAIAFIKKITGVELPPDEAGFIALHIVNARSDREIEEIEATAKIISSALKIITFHYAYELDKESLNYNRFVVHMKYFIGRVFDGNMLNDDDPVFCEMIKKQYTKAYECAQKIGVLVQEQYKKKVTMNEIIYLAIHIQRITASVEK